MAITFVQKTSLGTSGASSGAVSSGAFGTNPTVGNYIIIWAWGWTSNAGTISPALADTGSNSYTTPANVLQKQSLDLWCTMGYTKVGTSGASFKVSVTPGVNGGSVCVCGAEFSGLPASAPGDGAPIGTTGTTGAPAPGSMAISAGDLTCAVMTDDDTTTTTPTTPTNFISVQAENSASIQIGEAVYVINLASPSNPAWQNFGSFKWGSSQMAFKAGAAAFTGFPPEEIIAFQETHWSEYEE